MTPVDTENIPAVYVVINGPLGMSPGKIAAQTFQLQQRQRDEAIRRQMRGDGAAARLMEEWHGYTTTVTRLATTPTVWERVKAEVEGVLMVDEGYTEVPEGSETVFASWPLLRREVPKILTNAKCPLYRHDEAALLEAYLAGLAAGADDGTGASSAPEHLLGNSAQETQELRAKAFRGWYSSWLSAE